MSLFHLHLKSTVCQKKMQTLNSTKSRLITFWGWKVQKQNKIIKSCQNENDRWFSLRFGDLQITWDAI